MAPSHPLVDVPPDPHPKAPGHAAPPDGSAADAPAVATDPPPGAPHPGPLGRLASWAHAVDPFAVACGLVALVVYTLRGFDGPLSRDLGVYAYGGQSVADGNAPYVAILNRAGPLAHLVPGIGAAAARLVGVDDLRGMRVLSMLIAVAAVVTVYLVGRGLFARRAAGLVAAAALLSFEGFTVYASNGPREKTTMVLFLALAMLALVHRRWGTAGAMVALGTLTWQPVFLPAIAAVGLAALLGRDRLRALLRIVVGGLVPTAATVLAYAAIGRLQLFLDDFVLINLRYTDQTSLFDRPSVLWASLSGAYGWSVWVMGAGLVLLPALGAVALARRTRSEPRNAALAGLGLAVPVCVAWSAAAFNGWPDAYVALPLAAVGFGGLVPLLARPLPVRALTAVVAAWVLVVTVLAAAYSVSTRSDILVEQRSVALAVKSHLPPGAEFVSISAPNALVLMHAHNLTRVQIFGHGLTRYVNETWPGGVRGYGRRIEARAPALVLMGQERVPHWLQGVLHRSYVDVGSSRGQVRWFLHRDVAPERRSAIRAALHDS